MRLDFKLTLLSYFLSCFKFFSLILFVGFSKILLFSLFFLISFLPLFYLFFLLFSFSTNLLKLFPFSLLFILSKLFKFYLLSLMFSLFLCELKSKSKLCLKSFSSLENLAMFWMNASPMSMKFSILACCSLMILNEEGMKCFHMHAFNA